MPLPLIKAIAQALIIVALVVPVVTGFLGKRLRLSVMLGWGLYVLAAVYEDVFAVLLAKHFHGPDGVSAVLADNSTIVPAILCAWMFAVLGHNLGDIVAGFAKRR